MKKIHFSLVVMMLVTVLLAFGGCGGGSSAVNPKQALLLQDNNWDQDGDGTPDVFDDYPTDKTKISWGYNIEDLISPLGAHNSPETAVGASGPMAVPFSVAGVLKSPDIKVSKDYEWDPTDAENPNPPLVDFIVVRDDNDHYAFNLSAGKHYSLVFYDIYGERAVDFVPEVKIFAQGDEPLALTVNTTNGVELSAVVLSFVPKKSGVHYVSIRNPGTAAQTNHFPYVFDMLPDDEGTAMPITFFGQDYDGKKFNYSMDDLAYLRGALLDCVELKNDFNDPVRMNKVSADIAWKTALDTLNAPHNFNGTNNAPAGKTEIDPIVQGVRWHRDAFTLRHGIDAPTGDSPAGLIEAPVVKFDLPDRDIPVDSKTFIHYVNSVSEHEEEMSAWGKFKLGLTKLLTGVSGEYGNNIKYSQTSTTLVINYVVKEAEYRKLDPGEYELTETGQEYFEEHGADKFREKYGDYFVAGVRKGASYTATLSITMATSEQLKQVVSGFDISIAGIKIGIEWLRNVRQMYKEDMKVDIKVFTHGGIPPTTEPTLQGLIDGMNEFKSSVTKDNMANIEAVLLHYGQIKGGKELNIPRVINVHPELFLASRAMMNAYITLTAAKDTIANIQSFKPAHMKNATVIENMVNRYSVLSAEYSSKRSDIIKDKAQVDAWTQKFTALRDEFRLFLERYKFFQDMLVASNALGKFFADGAEGRSYTLGFESYSLSSAVDKDIEGGYYKEDDYYRGTPLAWDTYYWYPEWDLVKLGYRNYTHVFIRVGAHHKLWGIYDENYQSLGKQRIKFKYCGKKGQSAGWSLKAKLINLGNDWGKYPFNWDRIGM